MLREEREEERKSQGWFCGRKKEGLGQDERRFDTGSGRRDGSYETKRRE